MDCTVQVSFISLIGLLLAYLAVFFRRPGHVGQKRKENNRLLQIVMLLDNDGNQGICHQKSKVHFSNRTQVTSNETKIGDHCDCDHKPLERRPFVSFCGERSEPEPEYTYASFKRHEEGPLPEAGRYTVWSDWKKTWINFINFIRYNCTDIDIPDTYIYIVAGT